MIDWNQQQQMVRTMIRKFVETEINPYVDSTGQLDTPPAQAAAEYIAIIERFLEERNG